MHNRRGRWVMIGAAVTGMITLLSQSSFAEASQTATSPHWAGLVLTNPSVDAVYSVWDVPRCTARDSEGNRRYRCGLG